ncbi:MAG TPA: 3-hydroxybutyrate dehydrogenase [Chloroflexaceae bacterium]|nr:3-hydroxybutyrate dehydrogenase [Chloroflexaceae bacterium]
MTDQRVAVVTGGGSGIGRAVAEHMAVAGYRVVVVDLPGSEGQAVADAVGGLFVGADLGRREECRRVIDAAQEQFGRVDALVNNAGYQHIDALEVFPEDRWDNMLAVMLTAPFLLMRYAWPGMQARGWGRVINIGSVHSLRASPFKIGYVSAKHGLLGLTRTAAVEGGPHGITVNLIAPAYVRTPLVEKQIADQARTRGIPEDQVIEKVMLEPAAVKRLIEPAEVAELVLFLCSDAAGTMTGSVHEMALGWTAR